MLSKAEREKAEKYRSDVIDLMLQADNDVNSRLRSSIEKIIALSYALRINGKRFSFSHPSVRQSKIPILFEELNRSLENIIRFRCDAAVRLSAAYNGVKPNFTATAETMLEEKEEQNVADRIDTHTQRIRSSAETFIAAGLFFAIPKGDVFREYMRNIHDPNKSDLYGRAVKEGGFAAQGIRDKRISYGRGILLDVPLSISLLEANTIFHAYNRANWMAWGEKRKAGFLVLRGSHYECPLCDSYANGSIHVHESDMPPYHTRCVCMAIAVSDNYAAFSAYNGQWEQTYYDHGSNGYLVTSRDRITYAQKSKNEQEKYEKEKAMGMALAKKGFIVEHLSEKSGVSSYDALVNHRKADFKRTKSHNNIVKYAEKAINKQGADIVVIQFDNETQGVYDKINEMKRKKIPGYYFFTENPDKIYHLN